MAEWSHGGKPPKLAAAKLSLHNHTTVSQRAGLSDYMGRHIYGTHQTDVKITIVYQQVVSFYLIKSEQLLQHPT